MWSLRSSSAVQELILSAATSTSCLVSLVSISAGASTITNLLPICLFLCLSVLILQRLRSCTFFGLFVLAKTFVTLSASWSESESVSPMLKKLTSGVAFFFRS